jgi:hypothetical protein
MNYACKFKKDHDNNLVSVTCKAYLLVKQDHEINRVGVGVRVEKRPKQYMHM